MSTTLFAAFGILAPVHGFLRKFTKAKVPAARASSFRPGFPSIAPPALPIGEREFALTPTVQPAHHHPRARVLARSRSHTNTPLRVVQVMDGGQAGAHGGRMVISGRMADVCAELDRMAAREAAMHARA